MQLSSLFKAGLLVSMLGLGAVYVTTIPSVLPPGALKPRNADLGNGEAMFNAGGCASCHATPKEANRLKLGGGLALPSPFGTFRVPNISPDPEAGIGAWSELQFVNAMLKGVGRNNEHLYPAFPYTSYQRMALDDVRDLYAFSRTLPPDATASRPHELPLPFRFRRLLGVWKLLFLDGKPFVPDPAKEAVYHRGAYLIEGPAHCAECHSARNVLGGITPSERFAGGAAPDGKGWVPNLTPHANALATWSVTDMAFFLKTGLAPDGSSVGSSMSEVIRNTSRLTPDDRRAMAVYLKALPPRPGRKPATK